MAKFAIEYMVTVTDIAWRRMEIEASTEAEAIGKFHELADEEGQILRSTDNVEIEIDSIAELEVTS